ncbi:heptaprenyl diphosphate synthase component 1 [Paenibacillus sp. 481]|uniref:heptaprenyl diphosphate synthase component 1 n=1 Tax=Paenibacillus sp. 481 TaxID=2835869 RepID=UPI001E50AF5F|nr:heptaprenyl diphosphate synthase component 1 [Paenibacillus sp. 481]UHA75568.1 heptaprenyl diphosphate synthase component 1 [Paenibacillus sp. 481]
MNRILLQDTYQQLGDVLSPVANIALQAGVDEPMLLELATMLLAHDIQSQERFALLGCYALLLQALRTHQHVPLAEADAAKAVLDGDYLLSMYYQHAVRNGLTNLISYLATTVKRVQIHRVAALDASLLLHQRMSRYVQKSYKRSAYEVI